MAEGTGLLTRRVERPVLGSNPRPPTKYVVFGIVAQMAEHPALNRKRVGSMPTGPTKLDWLVVSTVAQQTFNLYSGGSNPPGPTNLEMVL